MTRPDFERTMARLREQIAALPEDRRAELEALAAETVARHDDIARNSLQAHRALERLELSFEKLQAACEHLQSLAADARDTLERSARLGSRPAPGLN